MSVTALSSQTVGQPLILQCSVTTIRDINSRVDFVWIGNGTELERVEVATGESSTNNLLVYTDYYVVPQLSTIDDNNLYICKVIINTVQLVSAAGDITLNLNMQGKTIMYVALYTVQFNYNFIFTRVSTRGNTRYFACV